MLAGKCLSAQILGSYAAGTISAVDAVCVDTHLSECAECLARLDELAAEPDPLVRALRSLEPAGPPPRELAAAVEVVLSGAAGPGPSAATFAGVSIGGYRIVDQLGHGGMGRVYRAMHPRLNQEVALKVLRPGMDTAPILARFEAERQALALMDHPHIARVSDGGLTDDGQPFFVMELVRGVPITRYCQQHNLDVRQRLELFLNVCQAVQHAHQKGVIHRDLKPSNILVAEYDGRPNTKVIDFGVARAIERTGGAETEVGMLVGTPEYMSPEQATLTSRDIDTRSDIYALGVLLYELQTGETPIANDRVRELGLLEVLRLIREEDPPAPSLRQIRKAEDGIRKDKSTPHFALHTAPLNELDWIALKALEKDRNHRYQTAAELADDVHRFLNDELVLATPPSNTYRLGKLVRRHRRVLATVAAFVLVLLGGIVVSTWQAMEAREAQTQAEVDRDKAQAAERQAKHSAEEARSVLTFFQERIMAVGRPEGQEGGLGSELTIRAAVDAAEPHIAESFMGQPLVEASVRHSLGMTYLYVGDPAAAIVQLERAWELRRDSHGPDHADTVASLHDLGVACEQAGQIERAESLLEEAWRKRHDQWGAEHRDTLRSMSELAVTYRATGKLDQAVDLANRAVAGLSAELGPDHLDTLYASSRLAMIDQSAGKLKQAVDLGEKTVEGLTIQLGDEHPATLAAINQLGLAYREAGELDRALSLFSKTLEIQKRKLGPNHLHTLTTMSSLALVYFYQRQMDKSVPLFEQVVEGRKAKLPPDHPSVLDAIHRLANAYQVSGKANEALPLLERIFHATQARLGKDHSDTLGAMHDLAALNFFAGNVDRAIDLHKETQDRRLAKLGPDHPDTLQSMSNLAYCYWNTKRYDLAIPLWEQTVQGRIGALGQDHPLTLQALINLSDGYGDDGQLERSLSMLEEALADRQARLGPDHSHSQQLVSQLTRKQVELGHRRLLEQHFVEAEALLRPALKVREQVPDSWLTFSTRSMLGAALVGQKKYAEAEPLLVSGYEGMKQREAQIPANAKDRLTEGLERLVQLYDDWGKPGEADKWRPLLPTKTDTAEQP